MEKLAYSSLLDELYKIAQVWSGAALSRRAKGYGGASNMMNLGVSDSSISDFNSQVMDLVDQGQYGKAKMVVMQAGFPTKVRDRMLSSINQMRGPMGIPPSWRHGMLLQSLDS